jgi:hypothetical protein
MTKTLRKLVACAVLIGATACALPLRKVDLHPMMKGCIERMSVKISYNNDESWRIIRMESPDGCYVEAEDYVTDKDGHFNSYTHSPLELNHPLRKYASFEILEEIYQKVKSGELKNVSKTRTCK